MENKLIIDDNSVYEIDEECMKKLGINNQEYTANEKAKDEKPRDEKKEPVNYYNTYRRRY